MVIITVFHENNHIHNGKHTEKSLDLHITYKNWRNLRRRRCKSHDGDCNAPDLNNAAELVNWSADVVRCIASYLNSRTFFRFFLYEIKKISTKSLL